MHEGAFVWLYATIAMGCGSANSSSQSQWQGGTSGLSVGGGAATVTGGNSTRTSLANDAGKVGLLATSGSATAGTTAGGTATSGGSPANGAAAGMMLAGCPGTGGPTMVKLPGGYCIDSTEVTRSQYSAWLKTTTAATINAQDVAACNWNTSFAPDAACMSGSYVCTSNCDNMPQVCTDWCDAVAYCNGVGKRLCGMIGGGPNSYQDVENPTTSQWYAACTSGGTSTCTYPYCGDYSTTTCNGYEYFGGDGDVAITRVGTLSGCQAPAPYAGVFDLSGNVAEMEDACESTPGRWANCRVRGGNFCSVSANMTCSAWESSNRGMVSNFIGFRCCAP